MERWDIYDKNRIKTGRTIERGSAFSDSEYHIVIHVCLFNHEGKMLIQQRQPFKEGWSNLWDVTVGGSAIAGDASQTAAEREVYEEIGYRLDLREIRPHLTVNFEFGFDDYYLLEAEVEIDNLKLQYEEVHQVKWASKEEILSMIDSGEFIPYYKHLICLLFDMRVKYSAHSN